MLAHGEAGERNGSLRVLGVGRLVAKKGLDTLVEACAVLDRRGVEFEALIVGQDDKHGDAIRARVAQRGLENRVRLVGAMGPQELLEQYRRASTLCMPCRLLPNDRDGIPNVLVEAMAVGTPVVATPVSGIPELIEDGDNGLLVPPENPEALADALLRVRDDAELAGRLTSAARATVAERFDGDRLARELATLFEEATC
jgi:glycosyltransferase involved in cell wall biosynthesis